MRVWSGGSSQSRLQRSTSQNACQRGSSGSALNSGLGADVPEVAAEPPVAQAGADILMAGDEPAVEPLVVVDGGPLAQAPQNRVRIAQKRGVRGIELRLFLYKHGLTIRLNPPS